MAILSGFVTETSPVRMKAPSGSMYEIHSIFLDTNDVVNNAISIYNYLMEDEITVVDPNTTGEGLLMSIECDVQRSVNFVLPIPEKTKYITAIARSVTAGLFAHFAINYQLVTATKLELLMEWFRKGR